MQALEGHYALIVDHRALWAKRRLDALIALIGFAGFADNTNGKLSRQAKLSTQAAIDMLLKFKLIRAFARKGVLCHGIAGSITCVHRFQEGTMLLWAGGQLQKQRLFHAGSTTSLGDCING